LLFFYSISIQSILRALPCSAILSSPFFVHLFREYFGLQSAKPKTLPVQWGIDRAKIVALFFGFVFLFAALLWCNSTFQDNHFALTILFVIIVILPSIYSLHKLFKANTSSDYKHISTSIKIIMLTGLIYLLILFFYEFSDKI